MCYVSKTTIYAMRLESVAFSLYFTIFVFDVGMGCFLGLNIVYTYAASGEVTQLPIDVAWACTNLWAGLGVLLGPLFSG